MHRPLKRQLVRQQFIKYDSERVLITGGANFGLVSLGLLGRHVSWCAKDWENGFAKSFDSRLRDEFLAIEELKS